MISIKSQSQISKMQKAGEIVALTHRLISEAVSDGISTADLNRMADEFIRSKGAYPSFKGYNSFPGSICTSINDVVIHGIPDNTKLKNGDIISVDIGALYDGFHGDSAATYPVGKITPEAEKLITVTKESFYEGIKNAVEGKRVSDISYAVQQHAEKHGFSVVREFVGHGLGQKLHEEPEIPNYGVPGKGPRLYRGMTFAVEPMINAGKRDIYVLDDNWTVKTQDGSLSAHYEHSVVVTKDKPVLLTIL